MTDTSHQPTEISAGASSPIFRHLPAVPPLVYDVRHTAAEMELLLDALAARANHLSARKYKTRHGRITEKRVNHLRETRARLLRLMRRED